MFKLIAQFVISATVGLAVAAGSDANVRGYIGEALQDPSAYIQESASAIANTALDISTQNDTQANVNADANANANDSINSAVDEVITTTENATDVTAQSSTDVQVDSSVNVENVLPDFLGLDAGGAVDTQTQSDTSLETEDLDLSLLEQLGLSLGFDVDN